MTYTSSAITPRGHVSRGPNYRTGRRVDRVRDSGAIASELRRQRAGTWPTDFGSDTHYPCGCIAISVWKNRTLLRLRDIMTRYVVTLSSELTLCSLPSDAEVPQAADYLRRPGVHRLLVIYEGQLCALGSPWTSRGGGEALVDHAHVRVQSGVGCRRARRVAGTSGRRAVGTDTSGGVFPCSHMRSCSTSIGRCERRRF